MAKRTESYMSPADIEAAGQAIYGDNWRAAMAEHLGIDPSLLWRYMTLRVAVPKVFAMAVFAMRDLKIAGGTLPAVDPVSGPVEPIARTYTRKAAPKVEPAPRKARVRRAR